MKRKWIIALIALIVSVFCCGMLFGCGEKTPSVPEVKNVTLTAEGDGYGKAGALHRIAYEAPEGSEISFSVARGTAPATAADYLCRDGGYVFYAAGEYTVTVYAAKDGMVGSASAKVTVTVGDAFLENVDLKAAAGETFGQAGALHVLGYHAAEGSTIDVVIEKDGAAATDAVYDGAHGTVVFGSAGTYTVKVTATLNGTEASGEKEIEIALPAAPEATLTVSSNRVQEDQAVTLTRDVVCAPGDEIVSRSTSALYRRGTSGDYRDADEGEDYEWIGDLFIPHVAGRWKLVFSVESKYGTQDTAEALLTCSAVPVTLSSASDGLHRIAVGQETEVEYLVSGAESKYDVTFDTHGNTAVTAEAGAGHSVRVTASEIDYFTVTVIYTHKITNTTVETLDLDFYSVENVSYAPAWGEDPFGGMPSDVLTSMGHLIYFDAESCGGIPRELTWRDMTCLVEQSTVTSSDEGKKAVEILSVASDEAFRPYVIVANYDLNDARGTFTLKMTVTDPVTGYSAVARKTFNVLATTNDNAAAAAFIQNYVEQHADFYDIGSMDYNKLCSDCRHNMVLTKTGTIMQRSNPDWALNNNSPNADFAAMDFDAPSAENRLEFRFELYGANPATGAAWLGIGLRTGNVNGWAGFFDLHAEGGMLKITCGLDIGAKSTVSSAIDLPAATAGAVLFVRLDRRVSGNLAEYIVSVKTAENAAYQQYLRCEYDVSSSAGNPGAPVAEYQFTHRNAGGCYAVEQVTITNYDA